MVPSMPTSFVKSACRPAAVMTGAGSSTPASAQVPVQTKANASSAAGTPATAAAVSCDGPMTTCGGRARPRPAATLGASGPASSPAVRKRGNSPVGTPRASATGAAQVMVRGSSRPVVEALVSSVPSCPDSQ